MEPPVIIKLNKNVLVSDLPKIQKCIPGDDGVYYICDTMEIYQQMQKLNAMRVSEAVFEMLEDSGKKANDN